MSDFQYNLKARGKMSFAYRLVTILNYYQNHINCGLSNLF